MRFALKFSPRKIPFNLSDMILAWSGPNPMLWHRNYGISLFGVGYSFALENAEYMIYECDKVTKRFIFDGEFRSQSKGFVAQEITHARYHRTFNEIIIGSGSVVSMPFRKRIYSFFLDDYINGDRQLLLRKLNSSDELEVATAVKDALKRTALFEGFTFVVAKAFFEFFFSKENIHEVMEDVINPAVLYLFGYHLTEELEHCEFSVNLFNNLYGSIECSDLNGSIANPFSVGTDAELAINYLTEKFGLENAIEEFRDNPFSDRVYDHFDPLSRIDVDPLSPVNIVLRNDLIRTWDSTIEPVLRDYICTKE